MNAVSRRCRRLAELLAVVAVCCLVAGALAAPGLATHSPSDIDGDGHPNATDNCANQYNDRGRVQQDQDLDGVGDACDASFYPQNGGTAWALDGFFVDENADPMLPSTCASVTIRETVYYGPPYNFESTQENTLNPCLTDGHAFASYHWRGSAVESRSRSYEIVCQSGGTLTGSLPDGVATYLPVGPMCVRATLHLYGGGAPGDFAPETSFDGYPTDWRGPYQLRFDALGTYDPEGGPVTYLWEFGDGQTSSLATAVHAYSAPGTYVVRFTATDVTGTQAKRSETLTIAGNRTVDFAPEVRLHPSESRFPMNPLTFIENSKLIWAHDAACNDDYSISRVTASKLGGGGYKHGQADDVTCREQRPTYPSSAYTRPYDGGNAGRAPIDDAEGFALDFNPAAAPSTFGAMPVWSQFTGNITTFWFFYGRSVPRAQGADLPAQHEGDWEHVNAEFDSVNVPTQIWYYAHGGSPVRVLFASVQRRGFIHPVAYSARGSHASYPDTGATDVCGTFGCLTDDRADGGPVWQTWGDIRPVASQPWYGFGGAWGEVGQLGDTTGPLGPSPYKNPAGL